MKSFPPAVGANMDGSPAYEGTLAESQILRQLPRDLAELIRSASGAQFLDALALAALEPNCTEWVFSSYEPLFVDLAARWLSLDPKIHQLRVISAFSRILPFAPFLRSFASNCVAAQDGPLTALATSRELRLIDLDDVTIRTLLLAVFRLFSFDLETFSNTVPPLQLQSLFQHSDRCVRYLAIRCFCLYMHAADAATEKMLQAHIDDGPIEGEWEGITIDYRLVGLWEERRWQTLDKQLQRRRSLLSAEDALSQVEKFRDHLTARTSDIGGVLVPKVRWEAHSAESVLVKTPTVVHNLQKIAKALLQPKPLLLVGLPNSGKTSLVNDVAKTIGQGSSMVTLHLNEQTDAKSLLGMYATSPMTGTFAWQPGVLTKAAREGRWILIEDLDRAPSEVIGLMLPIIEKGELIIPSRKERIKCADGFRIIATMKSSLNNKGEEIAPSHGLLGIRLWERIQINSLPLNEIRDVISQKYPLLSSQVPMLMDVYDRLCSAFHSSLAVRSSQGRTPGFRDLITLCNRLHRRLQRLGAKTGNEATPESVQDEIFLDAVDVFLRYLPDRALCNKLSSVVAEALQISPQRAEFCLHERTPPYADRDSNFVVGRESCKKMKVSKMAKQKFSESSSRFAPTRAALKTMEQIAAAVQVAEPVLLVGETGIGKTAVIQQLASLMRQKLTVVNLSQQSESTDLLGGFRPVNLRSMAVPLLDEFNQLFEQTFSAKKNQKFLSSVAKSVTAGNWPRLVNLWHEAVRMAQSVFRVSQDASQQQTGSEEQPSKKRKLDSPKYVALREKWETFAAQLRNFEAQATRGDSKFAFAFVQGKIVRALRNGEWVLLDEINLATPDILENIASLLHHGDEGRPSVLLSEAGDVERVYGHPDFRIFGAMNPATDAGKRDLAPGLRSRFTEIYVHSPDSDFDDLLGLIQTYLGDLTISDLRLPSDLAHLYLETKKLGTENRLTDGAGQRPHFSIRTLVRTLMYIVDHVHVYGIRRAAYEGFCMSFLTLLSQESEKLVAPLIEKYLFGTAKNARSLLGQTPRPPNDGHEYVQFKHYWMRKGPFTPEKQPHYIITPFIEKNLKNLLRASSTRRFPILLQGPTSAGKTSMVEYLAKISGNKFVRINNHDHTDLQEYLGSYVSTDDGTLRYQEGILVEALRHGYWIVLDELNLAPSDVLEALNRLLDDNRELFLPETQEVIHPHPNFMLFATQNPAGLYGGRKVLSRAFRNRFLELHFDDIPEDELEFILKERSQIAPSFCTRIVSVYKKLSLLRQTTRLFEQKNSFATLRDLFRWALRRADDREQLAINGFMLLAERVRNPQEREAVKKVIEDVMRVRIDEDAIYSSSELEKRMHNHSLPTGIVWTKAMRRLFILISQAIENNEPVLLVGETGCGKTQICQAVADIHGKELFTVNAHVNLETGDLIGAQRPLRNRSAIEKQLLDDLRALMRDLPGLGENIEEKSLDMLKEMFSQMSPEQVKASDPELLRRINTNMARSHALFEWSDGSLVTAMKTGQYFLLDEVSLADDSVLERLNSVLEPHRSLLLAEKGPIDPLVVAKEGFQFLATMNPGGDYGKRELSAALRNRLTEIWVPQLSEDEDILPILTAKLTLGDANYAKAMLEFAKWFKKTFQSSSATSVSIRDLLAWVEFVNKCPISDPEFALIHGAAMVFVDTLGANPSAMLSMAPDSIGRNRDACLQKLSELFGFDASRIYYQPATVSATDGYLCVGPFKLPVCAESAPDPQFVMDAPTTVANSVRIARGLQTSKPILLEGSPGVGKTTLVASLARALGKPLTRINLSEQTDLTDLFGSDVPVEGGEVGQFAWRDAPFLQAMQRGHWVLLDEMNLASQSVLEGLNSCLDHRQQVYVAELDQTFKRHPDFVLFAAQNPHHQGGGRKGLPASFVNRFTVVYADSFSDTDLKKICAKLFPGSPPEQTAKLVDFISLLNTTITQDRELGAVGGPWEINLRDISRWLQLADRGRVQIPSGHFLDTIITQRFRTAEDRHLISQLYKRTFGELPPDKSYYHDLTTHNFQVGFGFMQRDLVLQHLLEPQLKILPNDLPILESLILCIEKAWPSILVGPSGCGKTTTLRKLAALNGAQLVELALSADTDTMDLIGGFEQIDHRRKILSLAKDLELLLHGHIITALSSGKSSELTSDLLQVYQLCQNADVSLDGLLSSITMLRSSYPDLDVEDFLRRCNVLVEVSRDLNKVGFEWTEGALTEAIQRGYWVVLDNANLCNASVLDRLNSLMEPNGYLVLNEQRTEDGSARVIVPHPNFRLFLTMDPRNGELSRAMRNRSVEICFLPQATDDHSRQSVGPSYTCQSLLYRLRHIWNSNPNTVAEDIRDASFELRLDHLAMPDLARFQDSIRNFVSRHSDKPLLENLLPAISRYVAVMEENSQWKLLEGLSPNRHGQLVHPLVNEPLFFVETASIDQLIIVAYLQELKLNLRHMQQSLARANENAQCLKPSQMTRLERSLASGRIPALMKDSTQPVGSFLIDCSRALYQFIQDLDGAISLSFDSLSALRAISRFCWDIFAATQAREMDEGEFQTYLQIGQDIHSSALKQGSLLKPLASYFAQFLARFQSTWALTTGLSMQRIWDSWRPITCVDHDQLKCLVDLEEVVSEFTTVALQTRLDLAQLSRVRQSLIDAQNSVLRNGADGNLLVPGLKQQVGELASAVDLYDSSLRPHFFDVFETLCQYHDLPAIWSQNRYIDNPILNGTLPLLAGRPAHPPDASDLGSRIPHALQKLALYSGSEALSNIVSPWNGNFSLSLLEKLALVGDVTLGRLEFLETEEHVLSQALALSSQEIALDQIGLLLRAFSRVCLEVVELHRDFLKPEHFELAAHALRTVEEKGCYDGPPVPQLLTSESLPTHHYFREFVDGLSRCLQALTTRGTFSDRNVYEVGRVSIELAVICLRLFVPDKPCDPSLGLVIQRRRHAQQVFELAARDKALMTFEVEFSGQAVNLRRRLIQKELQELGSEPPASPVTRPSQSQLMQLQGEFSNLINSVLNRRPENYGAAEFREYGGLLHDNIQQICRRLRLNFRTYDDITILVSRFLQMLGLGISLVLGAAPDSLDITSVQAISERTPFLGGRQHPLSSSETRKRESVLKVPTDVKFQELSVLVAAHSADLSTLHAPGGLHALRRVLEFFHHIWKTQLREEQKEEAQRSSLYRYKGSFEDNEEADEAEFRKLFPTYEDAVAEEEKEESRIDPKSVSVKLSRLHAAIFEPGDAQTRMRALITDSTRLLGSVWSNNKSSSPTGLPPKAHLPGILLALEDEMKKFGKAPSRSYNFYTDANISEAKKLVSLVHSVRSRFLQLQAAWPEHAAIHDVLVCCQEVLQFRHVEPVAKFLTKVEKLHALVHEWQLVASKEYSAASVYDGLTALIISWRRLELSTWAKLLDMEKEKCEEDVSSWWFVAYEVLLAGPLHMVEAGEDITGYTQDTISTLESFFQSTTMGQFSPRLRLVGSFKSLLQLYAEGSPALNRLVAALENFLQYYRQFEPVISESLEEGRQSLEKEIKQQIQLASWKDTNITALRESARRSHYKLFKLVRKYRELLAQPTETLLQQGMPDMQEAAVHPATNGVPSERSSAASAEALAMCQQHDKTWNSRAPRFRDPEATAMNMSRVYGGSLTEFDVSSQLDNLMTDVIESIKDFKSRTPKTLTEENKETVQHLKTQKRRFYAETLRQLHFMGVKRNVSTVLQEEQATNSQVLATTSSLSCDNTSASVKAKSADSYFHRFLDLLPRVRQASREHSEDLNPVEVTRSAGSAEGLLLLIRKQRDVISPALRDAATLRSTSLRMRNLWACGAQSLRQERVSRTEEKQDMTRHMAWVAPIVGVGIEVIEIHSKFSGTDSSAILEGLRTWKDRLYQLKESLAGLPELPAGISSQTSAGVMEKAVDSLRQLSADVTKWNKQRPDLSFVLEQIASWADFKANTSPAPTHTNSKLTLDDLNEEFLSAVDKILVALQGVRNSLSTLPSSTEDKDWLAQTDSVFTKALKELHISEIAMSFDSVLGKLQFLQNGSRPTLALASAIITSLVPIVEQHQAICEDLIGRFLSVHREICKMSYVLAKSFTQVASEGFCSPVEESNEEGAAGKVESGTGLGEGEGAEDISKDVQDDEDLTELAQQQNPEQSKQDMEKSGDAVNMDQEDLEGEEYDQDGDDKEEDENESGSEGEEDDEIDEEVGSVDSLDPTAVDEKLWDGSHSEEQKETENEEGKGVSDSDQQAAANDKQKGQKQEEGEEQGNEEEEEDEEAPEDEGEAVGREEMDVTDPHAREEQTLDLPEEMQLDGDEKDDAGSDMDDGMDDLSDLGPDLDEEQAQQAQDETMDDAESASHPEDANMEDNEEGDAAEADDGKEAEKPGEEEPAAEEEAEQQDIMRTQRDDNDADGNDVAPSEAVSGGQGVDQDLNEEKGTSGDAQQQGGSKDAGAQMEEPNGATEDGQDRQKADNTSGGAGEQEEQQDPQSQAFKKLGDVLEQWHRRQREIMNSSRKSDSQTLPPDTDMADADFEHLADEDDVADTQALGQASEEQAKALDQKKAVESETTAADNEHLPDVTEDSKDPLADQKAPDDVQMEQEPTDDISAQTGTSFAGNTAQIGEPYNENNGLPPTNEALDEVDSHLAAIHLSSTLAPRTSPEEARRLWSHYESATNDLSLSLTEQLRLILAPTLATKLRGDFRTGKRLNIKRIIPYIASQYKRDKIWMRRSIPSKRNYQVMLAVDDSKSMQESGSGQLAFETLALVARSLSMLEVGDLCIVGFGDEEHVRVAHEFGKPFSSEAGIQVFQQFSYQQTGTNVRKLVADSIALFREARARRSSAGNNAADLWQLELIISDGICEDHDTIRRLVRQAQEERIMIVFIILDAAKGSSILDLTQASFEPDDTGEMKLKMKRYLEGFPFSYYLVVRDVRELPAVLAMALKQWFAEVVEVSS
ncbi:hypothetical protein VTN77DRAFT_4844 [Rasamsonia byssochlamydoides]|uniref:uncharacterized protein n=1 Tax=Rasamsonia byssochlamydoides TaxID=89139 RepID=UPI003742A9F6